MVKTKNVIPQRPFCTMQTIFKIVTPLWITLLAACSSIPNHNHAPSQKPPVAPELGDSRMIGDAAVGAYIRGAAWNKTILFDLEEAAGHEFAIIQWFTGWPAPYEAKLVSRVHELERLPLITWQSNKQSLKDINAGLYDDYIRSWAQQIAKAQDLVYLRPFPEMNGDWTNWHGDPDKLVTAWQRLVKIFRDEGATQVRWVWSPNVTDEPRTPENRMELYYPGESYVDVLALDGYNWGNTRPWTAWQSFDDIFEEPYKRVSKLGKQPIWIAEVASTEIGGDKAAWIQDMLSSSNFPRVDAVIWFNENKETDWRIESSENSLNAFRQWFDARQDESDDPASSDMASAPTIRLSSTGTNSMVTNLVVNTNPVLLSTLR